MDTLDLLNPLKYYQNTAKEQYHNNAVAFFEDLARQSGIDIEQNRITVNKYNEAKANLSSYMGKSGKAKFLRVLLIIFCIVFGIASLLLLILGFSGSNALFIALGFVFLALVLNKHKQFFGR